MEEDRERVREMKMQEAERQRERLYQIYERKSEEIRNVYEGMIASAATFTDSDAAAAPAKSFLDEFTLKVNARAVRLAMMHRSGKINFEFLEECMQTIFELLDRLILYVKRSMSEAGDILAAVIHESLRGIIDSTLDLLKCSIGEGPRGPLNNWKRINNIGKRVSEAIKYYKDYAAVLRKALVQVVDSIKIVLGEMMGNGGSSTGKSIREEASTSNYGGEVGPGKRYSPEAKRIVRAMAIRVGTDGVQFIEELMPHLLVDTNGSDLIMDMESLVETSVKMKDNISKIKQLLCPLTAVEIHYILQALDTIKRSISHFWRNLAQPEMSPVMMGECFQKRIILRNTMRGFKFILLELIRHQGRTLLDELLGTTMCL